MELVSLRITSSKHLNDLEGECHAMVRNYPRLTYFSDYMELETNASTLFKFSDDSRIVILGERMGTEFVSNPWSFVSSFYVSGLRLPLVNYLPLVFEYFSQEGVQKIRFRTPPNYVDNDLNLPRVSYRDTRGFTSVVKLPTSGISNRRKRLIRKASKNGYIFGESSEENWLETWEFLETFHRSRGLPSLGFERVLNLVQSFPTNFQLVRVQAADQSLIGAALLNRIAGVIRVPNYYGDKNFEGSTDFLISRIIDLALSDGYDFVDLGFSSDPTTGLEVEGIVNFKSEFSASKVEIFDDVICLK